MAVESKGVALLREASLRILGGTGKSLPVVVNRVEDLVGRTFEDEEIPSLIDERPWIKHIFSSRVMPPPEMPQEIDLDAAADYLKESRLYRLKHPTVNLASKEDPFDRTRSSTGVKFELGIDTTGCVHVGSGRPSASSCPLAKYVIDPMTNGDLREDLFPILAHEPDILVVSDAALSSGDGLGMGEFRELINMTARLWKEGRPALVKVSLRDADVLSRMGVPYNILYKPREHNLEIIISVNIPGCGLDDERVLARMVTRNAQRNEDCYRGEIDDIPPERTHHDNFFDRMGEERDFAARLEDVHANAELQRSYVLDKARERVSEIDVNKVNTMVQQGYINLGSSVNADSLTRTLSYADEWAAELQIDAERSAGEIISALLEVAHGEASVMREAGGETADVEEEIDEVLERMEDIPSELKEWAMETVPGVFSKRARKRERKRGKAKRVAEDEAVIYVDTGIAGRVIAFPVKAPRVKYEGNLDDEMTAALVTRDRDALYMSLRARQRYANAIAHGIVNGVRKRQLMNTISLLECLDFKDLPIALLAEAIGGKESDIASVVTLMRLLRVGAVCLDEGGGKLMTLESIMPTEAWRGDCDGVEGVDDGG